MSSSALDRLERFTRLAFLRRRRALRDEERVELDGLLQQLSQEIEGFHPPRARTKIAPAASEERPAAPPMPSPPEVDPFEEKTDPLASTETTPELPANVQSVDLSQRRSSYTPKQQAVFLEDYYGADFVPDQTGELPKVIVDAEGHPVTPTGDIQWFLRTGSLEPSPDATSAQATSDHPDPSAAAPVEDSARSQQARRKNAIVHLKAGGTLRGRPLAWPPAEAVDLESPKGPQRIERADVLAVFATGAEAVALGPELGVAVTLANDKVLKGRTKDYVKGAQAFTLVPDPKRPGVDVVWIPAHAVKSIGRM